MLSTNTLRELLESIPYGAKSSGDSFFEAANKALVPEYKKLGVITIKEYAAESEAAGNDDGQHQGTAGREIYCNAFGCREYFQNVATYQTHFNSMHRFICAQCKRSMPTAHLLDLHLSEQHDAYFAARVDRGDSVYACLLEECRMMFKCMAERKEHCIKEHKFPSNYRYFQHGQPAEQRNSKSKGSSKQEQKSGEEEIEMDAESLENNNNALDSLPSNKLFNFSFGHPTSKTFYSKTKKKGCSNKATLDDMSDLKMALDE